jgi:hypothetical protein
METRNLENKVEGRTAPIEGTRNLRSDIVKAKFRLRGIEEQDRAYSEGKSRLLEDIAIQYMKEKYPVIYKDVMKNDKTIKEAYLEIQKEKVDLKNLDNMVCLYAEGGGGPEFLRLRMKLSKDCKNYNSKADGLRLEAMANVTRVRGIVSELSGIEQTVIEKYFSRKGPLRDIRNSNEIDIEDYRELINRLDVSTEKRILHRRLDKLSEYIPNDDKILEIKDKISTLEGYLVGEPRYGTLRGRELNSFVEGFFAQVFPNEDMDYVIVESGEKN